MTNKADNSRPDPGKAEATYRGPPAKSMDTEAIQAEPPTPFVSDMDIAKPTFVRYEVLGILCFMSFILYLHRVCISQAVTFIQDELKLTNLQMGFVLGAFTLAYGLFEVPVGHMGDRRGSRRVLPTIVLIWSILTMLTGLATGFVMLVIVRFFFGFGEAGAFPNAIKSVERWFPPHARGPALGIMIMCALSGGALAPLVAQWLIDWIGWRGAFIILGVPGLLWAAAFYWWYRDDPAEHSSTNEAERRFIAQGREPKSHAHEHPPIPWRKILTSTNVWLMGGISTCLAFNTYLFFSWYSAYLRRGRELSPDLASQLTSMVLVSGAAGSFLGGYLSDWMIRRTGERTWSRRLLATPALFTAATAMMISIQCDEPWLAGACAAWACFAIHLTLPGGWCVVTEISGPHVGAIWGLLNSLGVPGALGSQLFLGFFVDFLSERGYSGRAQWDPAFYIYATLLVIGAFLWLFVNPEKRIDS